MMSRRRGGNWQRRSNMFQRRGADFSRSGGRFQGKFGRCSRRGSRFKGSGTAFPAKENIDSRSRRPFPGGRRTVPRDWASVSDLGADGSGSLVGRFKPRGDRFRGAGEPCGSRGRRFQVGGNSFPGEGKIRVSCLMVDLLSNYGIHVDGLVRSSNASSFRLRFAHGERCPVLGGKYSS
jgi:hypothetical protein